MRSKIGLIVVLAAAFACMNAPLSSAQDQQAPDIQPAQNVSMPAPETAAPAEMQWVWAEVVSIDSSANQMTAKYLDYETDTEKEMTISVDEKTTYENVKSLIDIKPTDTVSIDYIITPDGKNLAKNINVEKAEGAQSPATEETPAKLPVKQDTAAQGNTSTEATPQTQQ